MHFLYNLTTYFATLLLHIIAWFNPKIKRFVDGRKNVFSTLESQISTTNKCIWFHAASLGEFEQGLPVMEEIRNKLPTHKIVLTFFSPSGYEVRKNTKAADLVVYLPLDTPSNARKFIEIVRPEMAFFIKYEYWPNYLNELKKKNIPTYLISGIFRKNQLFFKWYGGFYRKALDAFHHFFVQNSSSKALLLELKKTNATVSGDTRFDRVASILQKNNSLDFIEAFKNDTLTIVVGSSWPKDEELLVNFINSTNHNVKFIIAPHNIKAEQISNLKSQISKKTILFSDYDVRTGRDTIVRTGRDLSLQAYDVFIIDTIGILTKIYSYADIAYVGGGFGNPGVHNILEPATFGVPIIIGANYSHFAEAIALVNMEGCISISNQISLNEAFENLIQNEDIRAEKGHICSTFVQMNKNATQIILNEIL
jgi:3-deoxy-D-manno-octulosonic-acid transferase